jgi:TP901 family phage tail tape measure protein
MAQMKQEYILKAVYEGKGELSRLQSDLKTLGKIESIKALGKDIRELNTRFDAARKKLVEQAREMRAADTVTKEMSAAYKAAQREVGNLAAAIAKKKAAFKSANSEVRASGVDSRNLAAEEKRLLAASRETGKVWAARQALGVKSHRDIKDEVARLTLAYQTLKNSGTATALEIYQAKQKLREKTKELTKDNFSWSASFDGVRNTVVGLAAMGAGLVATFKEFAAFETGMAEIYTLVDMGAEKFDRFKEKAKGIIGDLPQETGDLTKAIYDIVSSGVALEDSLAVLDMAAKAATAGVTETKTAVNIGVGAMNAYGKSVGDLQGIYDILFQTVKFGVTTFPELAQHMGEILPTARAAGVDIKNVGAAIAALTKAGIRTPQAATAMQGAIMAMAAPAPEAREKFQELGITWQGLLPTLEAIRKRGLSIAQMRMLIPDIEASKGILSLTQNLDDFKTILASMDQAAGSTQAAYAKMADTPDHQIKLMQKSLHDLGVQLGELASVFLIPAAKGVSTLVNAINEAPGPIKALVSLLGAAATGTLLWKLGLSQLVGFLGGVATKAMAGQSATMLFTGAVVKARVAVGLLTAVMAANPVGAGIGALILVAASAWAIFGKSSLQASKDHAAAAEQIGEGRKAIDQQKSALERLQQTLKETAPGTEAHIEAERELARILPGANLSLDEQGRIIAKVGDAASDNAKKLQNYLDQLKADHGQSFGLQLEQQFSAYQKADRALQEYKENLKNWYGIGEESTSVVQDLWRNVNQLSGTYENNIRKGEEVRANLGQQKAAYNDLLQAMQNTGMTAGQLSGHLDKMHMAAELKQQIIADYDKFTGVIKSTADAADQAASRQTDAFRQAASSIKDEYVRLAQEVKRILEEISTRQTSLSSELREMARGGMSDYSAWKDLKKEADEYMVKAREAAQAGNFKEAVRLADEAKAKYKELNTEVKENGKVMVSEDEARKKSMKGVKEAGELAIEILGKQEKETEGNAKTMAEKIGEFKDGWAGAFEKFLKDGSASVQAFEQELDALVNKPRSISISVNKSEAKQDGGMIGLKMAMGGGVSLRNMLGGGFFPGFGGGDRRHVIAEDGEYMLDKYRVRDAGINVIRAFHAGRYDIVITELMKKMGRSTANALRRSLGGIIDSIPTVPAIGPQYMAAGGSVQGGGNILRHEHTFRLGKAAPVTVYTDDRNAGRLIAMFKRAERFSS